MSEFSRAVLRFFLGLCLWWLCFSPFLAHDLGGVFIAASLGTVVFWAATLLPSARVRITATSLFLAGNLSMLLISHGTWPLSSAITGLLYTILAMVLLCLDQVREYPGKKTSVPKALNGLPIRRLIIFHAVWFTGMAIALFMPAKYPAHILISWTGLMLTLAAVHIWPFATSPEWLGYKTRRECFVSPRRNHLRCAADAVLLTIGLLIASLLFFY